MIKVYIASPYTHGDTATNVRRQIDTAACLMAHGFAYHAPLLSHFVHQHHPQPYELWLMHDIEWLECCDALIRLPGFSRGADRELTLAMQKGTPCFTSAQGCIEYFDVPFLANWKKGKGTI